MTSEARPLPARILKPRSAEQQEQEQARARRRSAFFRAVCGTVSTIITIAAAATLIAAFVLPVVKISDDSAEPTLANGSVLILLKTDKPKAGDICGFSWNGKTLVREIAAIAGDTVDLTGDGTLTVNGEAIRNITVADDIEFPFEVPQNCFFVIGCGSDSYAENFGDDGGCITADALIGRAVCSIYPQPRLITRR